MEKSQKLKLAMLAAIPLGLLMFTPGLSARSRNLTIWTEQNPAPQTNGDGGTDENDFVWQPSNPELVNWFSDAMCPKTGVYGVCAPSNPELVNWFSDGDWLGLNWANYDEESGEYMPIAPTQYEIPNRFTFDEFIRSATAARNGIDNSPDSASLANINNWLWPGMNKVRAILNYPVTITSGYRSPALNRIVGGADTSAHMHGYAADFRAPGFGTPFEIARALSLYKDWLGYDQLINEGSWIHIAFTPNPRGEDLTAIFRPGQRVAYVSGIRAV